MEGFSRLVDIFSSYPLIDVLSLSTVLYVPLYCLSVFFALKKRSRPIIGGALAMAKLFATARSSSVSFAMATRHTPNGGLFGACRTPTTVAFFSVMLMIGIICLLLNIYVFSKQWRIKRAVTTDIQV